LDVVVAAMDEHGGGWWMLLALLAFVPGVQGPPEAPRSYLRFYDFMLAAAPEWEQRRQLAQERMARFLEVGNVRGAGIQGALCLCGLWLGVWGVWTCVLTFSLPHP
jgi:hypothetical protein